MSDIVYPNVPKAPVSASNQQQQQQQPSDQIITYPNVPNSTEPNANLAQTDSKLKTKSKRRCKSQYYVDGKLVKLNFFDRIRLKLMSQYERRAFLAEKSLKQEQQQLQQQQLQSTTSS